MAELDDTIEKIKSGYEAAAYECRPLRRTHPDRLAVEATLHGFPTASVERCRLLEIGCASGGNLIPMAEQLSQSHFLGIDLSPSQVQVGSRIVRELELTNIELRCQDLMDFPQDAGAFDYIIAHGFYAWVPPAVQQRLLQVCQTHLAPRGIAYISYNTYPGWRMIEPTREMMLFHARRAIDPIHRVARGREILRLMSEETNSAHDYGEVLRSLNQSISAKTDHHLLHDEMGVVNTPTYFWSFMEQANTYGLEYLGDIENPWYMISPHARIMISQISADALEREQYLDFFINRRFRCSVLRRSEATPETNSSPASRMQPLHAAGNPPEAPAGNDAQGEPVFDFGTGQFKVRVSNPRAIDLLRHIRGAWPAAIPFPELQAWAAKTLPAGLTIQNASDELARLIELYSRMGLLELWPRSTEYIATTVSQRPHATRYTRWQAAHDTKVTSLRHEAIALDSGFRKLLSLLDGTRDNKAIVEELIQQKETEIGGNWPANSREHLGQMVDAALKIMASSSLLLNEKPGD